MLKSIYLDYAATTPVDKKVLDKMLPYFSVKFGNPSSPHTFGQDAVLATDKARQQAASFLNAEFEEIIFTGGSTEANNLAIFGVVEAFLKNPQNKIKPHIITSRIEHLAVLDPFRELEKRGVEATYLGVDSAGLVSVQELKNAIQVNTILVSIMTVNNEIGIIEPIREIGKTIHKINERREKDWKNARTKERGPKPRQIYFHTDATQALNFSAKPQTDNSVLTCDTKWNYVDLLSLSAHKIYGPKGVGVLRAKNGINLKPIQLGGAQERGRRSGTLNTPGIVGLGKAISLIGEKENQEANQKIIKLRDALAEGLEKINKNIIFNTALEKSIPSIINAAFPGFDAESLVIALDMEGIAISSGSACNSNKLEISHVLKAIGLKNQLARSSIRFSLGKYTSEEEIKRTLEILGKIIKKR